MLKRSAGILLFLLFTCLTLFVVEIVLNLTTTSVLRPHSTQWVFRVMPDVMPGIEGETHFTTNSKGFRGDEMPKEPYLHIVVLGGSAAECLYLDDIKAWPYMVQKYLRKNDYKAWVGNAALSGETADKHLSKMNFLIKQFPEIDLFIILVGINDFCKAIHSITPRKTALYQKTRIWHLFTTCKRLLFSRSIFQDRAGSSYVKWRHNRQMAKRIITSLPTSFENDIESYGATLRELIDVTKRSSKKIVLITQPTLWGPNLTNDEKKLLWSGYSNENQNTATEYYSIETLSEGIQRYNEKLLSICKELNVPCLDLASKVPKSREFFYDDCHLNEKGSLLVAEIVFDFLENFRQKLQLNKSQSSI